LDVSRANLFSAASARGRTKGLSVDAFSLPHFTTDAATAIVANSTAHHAHTFIVATSPSPPGS
jgi:hypothetical protein